MIMYNIMLQLETAYHMHHTLHPPLSGNKLLNLHEDIFNMCPAHSHDLHRQGAASCIRPRERASLLVMCTEEQWLVTSSPYEDCFVALVNGAKLFEASCPCSRASTPIVHAHTTGTTSHTTLHAGCASLPSSAKAAASPLTSISLLFLESATRASPYIQRSHIWQHSCTRDCSDLNSKLRKYTLKLLQPVAMYACMYMTCTG